MEDKKITNLVKDACFGKENIFGSNSWIHIKTVVKFSQLLAKELKADEEIVKIAAWLHDYAAISKKEWYENHHIQGAKLAEKILKKLNYSSEKIKRIKECIYTHRGSKRLPQTTLEQKILASADSMAHIERVDTLIHLVYRIYKMDLESGKKWVLAKLKRSWNKMMPQAKAIMKERYRAIKLILEV